jgi:hypothetical protein
MMSRFVACALLLTLLVSTASGQAQKNTTPPAPAKTPTSFTERLLKFLGISASPGTLKGPGEGVSRGVLWLADLQTNTTRTLTSGDGCRSPIFLTGANEILALRGIDVVQVPAVGGEGKKIYSVAGIVKLVGASSADPGTVLILLQGDSGGRPKVGLLTVSTGAVTPVPYDPASSQDLQMVENLEGWSRTYGDRRLYVKRQSKQALSGTVEWSDVFLQVGSQPPVNVSNCDGANCGQPSLSEDGRLVVFVRAEAE